MNSSRLLSIVVACVLFGCASAHSSGGGGSTDTGTGGSTDAGTGSSTDTGTSDSTTATCPPDCIGGEYVEDASGCHCVYYDCTAHPVPTCPSDADGGDNFVSCYRNVWVCANDHTCAPFDWGTITCTTGLVCQQGAWMCPS
jgi:hypothetical protein